MKCSKIRGVAKTQGKLEMKPKVKINTGTGT
jgi:hypothetical protein